ncbi:MAG: ATP-binding protein [Bdellovibrionales bacterium]|nr:ATP-binding protein [Bdellovibrionales bacterium]
MSMDFSEKLMKLHRATTKHYQNFDLLLKEYLSTGCEIFNLELGVASHIVDDCYKIDSVGHNFFNLKSGMELSLSETFCQEVIRKGETLFVSNASQSDVFKSHPAYLKTGMASCVSCAIRVGDKIYGTLCFTSKNPRTELFKDEEIEILEMMAHSVGQFIEVRHHQEKAEQAAKMALIGQLAGGIAHEINNPMAIIAAQNEYVLSYLKEKGAVDKDVEESLMTTKKTIYRVRDIIVGLKTLIGNGSTHLEPVNLRELIDTTMNLVFDKFRQARIEIINDVSPETIVYANRIQLSQVILNLAQNSYDAILENENRWVNFTDIKRMDMVELSVIDSGTGIEPVQVEKIMEPFYTTKELGEGTGLGLSLSKSIIERFGGELFYHHQNANTCFKIRLNQSEASHQSVAG